VRGRLDFDRTGADALCEGGTHTGGDGKALLEPAKACPSLAKLARLIFTC